MSVGSNIRRIRELRGLTQKELGLMCGFSASTADVRIRQYEAEKMVPKENKLKEIASALNVHTSALEVPEVTTFEELMHTLFSMENEFGLTIHRSDKEKSQFYFTFDEDVAFQFYRDKLFDYWYNERSTVPSDPTNPEYDSKKHEYEIWKCRFPIDLIKYEKDQISLFKARYEPLISAKFSGYKVRTISDFIRVVERVIRSDISTSFIDIDSEFLYVAFNLEEIYKANETGQIAIAELLAAINYLEDSSCSVHLDMNIHKGSYYLFVTTDNRPLKTAFDSVIAPFLKAYKNGEFDSDEELQIEYEDDLKLFNVPIIEE